MDVPAGGSNNFSNRGSWVNRYDQDERGFHSYLSLFMAPNPCALELTLFLVSRSFLFLLEQPGVAGARPGFIEGSQPLP